MNKIILISCVLSIAFSASAPQYGFTGCQNKATNCGTNGTCNGVSGTCTCAGGATPTAWGFKCDQTSTLIVPASTNDLSSCNAEVALATGTVAAACGTNLAAALVPLNWKISGAADAKTTFANFAIRSITGTRTASLTFTSTMLLNGLDYAEYQWIYLAYNNFGVTTPPSSFAATTFTPFAVSYVAAVQNLAQAYMLGNANQSGATQNVVCDGTPANSKALSSTLATWQSSFYAIDTTSNNANLGVATQTVGVVKNTIDAAYGVAWTSTKAIVGYMHLFKSWGNPLVVVKPGCLYSVLLIVQKVTTAANATTGSALVTVTSADLTNTKTQSLVFTDTNIDTNYVWATIPIALTGSGDTTGASCSAGSCTATSLVTGGSSIVYIYTTSLSNYLISFSLILSALTLSL